MNKDNKTNGNNDSMSTQTLLQPSQDKRKKTCAVGLPKTKKAFLNLYHVDKSVSITNDADECYFGEAPTLWNVNLFYGSGTSEEWLIYQLTDLSEFTGVSKKITAPQIAQMAQLIVGDYGYLKMTEVMLFLRRFKTGRYGLFYGNVDPIVIISALGRFVIEERNSTLAAHELEEAKKQRDKELKDKKNISYEEYLRTKPKHNK